MSQREEWGTRAGFILAAVGSAIGLGNIWRFPYIAYQNGGGAFFVPYLFALLTAGLPVLILEYSVGHRFRGSAPLAFHRIRPKAEWIGWWQVAIGFIISTYYSVVIAWAAAYTVLALGQRWGEDPDGFFFGDFLRLADEPGTIGAPVVGVVVPLVLIWALTLYIVGRGIRRGIEVATKIFIPLLIVLFLVLVVRAITLEGAATGLNSLFSPDWGEISNGGVWVAAYGQIFFSLSIAFAIMITYSSYLRRDSDLTNNAFIAGFSNSSFELLAGIGVFAAVGFMATANQIPVDEIATEGVGLAFVVFPQIINELPGFKGFFGVLFFLSLVIAGVSSLISIVQVYVAGFGEKFGLTRTRSVLAGGGVCAVVSLLYATEGGLYVLDAADHFVNNFGIVLVALVEIVAIAWIFRKLGELQAHANRVSDILLGVWWKLSLTLITPLVLGYMFFDNLRTRLAEPYGGYPGGFLLVTGWGVAVAALLFGFAAMSIGWRGELEDPKLTG